MVEDKKENPDKYEREIEYLKHLEEELKVETTINQILFKMRLKFGVTVEKIKEDLLLFKNAKKIEIQDWYITPILQKDKNDPNLNPLPKESN